MLSESGPGRGVQCPTPQNIINSLGHLKSHLSSVGTFSHVVYDSAWLSMIYTRDEDPPRHLFPECYEFVLREQDENGGWRAYGSHFDSVLNSLAALLALLTHRKMHGTVFDTTELEPRINDATKHIQNLLCNWDINSTVQVGFELLIIGLLRQLRDFEVQFSFPALPMLEKIHQDKMQRIDPKLIYSEKQTTLLHSLEAMVGIIDFDRVKHHCCKDTGILGSPAATAAYMIFAKEWDVRAEKYLRKVLESSGMRNKGSVPSAFPTPVFEIAWTLSSMLSGVVEVDELDPESLSGIVSFLKDTLQLSGGTVGFAPGLISDADDTARTLMTLQLLGETPDYRPMIEKFQAQDHFRTYDFERDPSFSANCNVLIALLCLQDMSQYLEEVSKALSFVLQRFEESNISDKWNVSRQYCAMLMAQAFVKILERYELGHLQLLDKAMVDERIPVAVCRILLHTIATQQQDGSWNENLEETSYGVLTIALCLCLKWSSRTTTVIEKCLLRGKRFVQEHYCSGEESHFLWVEKTTYESALLKMAYCSMAIHTRSKQERKCAKDVFVVPEAHTRKMAHILSTLPKFAVQDLKHVPLVLVEASHLSSFLRRHRQDLVPRDQIPMSKDKYLDFIPVLWSLCNAKAKHALPAGVVRDMTQLSLLNYQIDEYMETVVGDLAEREIRELISALKNQACERNASPNMAPNGHGRTAQADARPGTKKRKLQNGNHDESHTFTNGTRAVTSSPVERVLSVINRYIMHVTSNRAVLAASPGVRRSLKKELYTFLLAHITHNGDNLTMQEFQNDAEGSGFACPDIERSSYFKWVNTTGADDTSCPMSFQYFACLVSYNLASTKGPLANKSSVQHCFEGAQATYVAEAVARRLAAMCRMYNDYGSAARDVEEGNLNSLYFMEFHRSTHQHAENGQHMHTPHAAQHIGSDSLTVDEETKKSELMCIAEFEREAMEQAMKRLEQLVLNRRVLDMLRVFIDVTDSFGLMYVQKDIASKRLKRDS